MAIVEVLNSQNKNDLLKLDHGVFLVNGVRRAALYDTTRGNVYSLNQEAAQSIKGEIDNQEFWQRLSLMGLAFVRQNLETESATPELEIPKPNLRFAWLEITDQCNERCLHCYGGFSPNRKEKAAQPLTYDYWRDVIQQLSKNGCQII